MSIDQLVLHPTTKARYSAVKADPPQSILLIGPTGSGRETILRQLAGDITGQARPDSIIIIQPEEDKNTIGIDVIRELKVTLRLKSAHPRTILIPRAELLSVDAQNSFLKLLEEPPTNVHFLMAATKLGDMLQTIQSRSSIWQLTPPTKEQLKVHLSNIEPSMQAKAIAISQGRIGLLAAIVDKQDDHELLQAIDTVKEILAETHFNRLIRVDVLAKDYAQTTILIEAFILVCKAALEQAVQNSSVSAKQWHARLTKALQAESSLASNTQPKLVLDNLFLTL